MKFIFIITLILNTSIYSQNNGIQNDDIYIIYEKSNKLMCRNLSNKNYKILKYSYKTKRLQDEYIKDNQKIIEPKLSFYLNFYYYKEPIKVENISNFKLTLVERISKGELIIGTRTNIHFIEKINDNLYLIFETRMEFEE